MGRAQVGLGVFVAAFDHVVFEGTEAGVGVRAVAVAGEVRDDGIEACDREADGDREVILFATGVAVEEDHGTPGDWGGGDGGGFESGAEPGRASAFSLAG